MKMMMIQTAVKSGNLAEKWKARLHTVVSNERGNQNVGQAIVILISVVLGALLLAGLYTLLDEVVLPTVTAKVQAMFEYGG